MLHNDAHITVDYLCLPDGIVTASSYLTLVCMYWQEEWIRLERRAVNPLSPKGFPIDE